MRAAGEVVSSTVASTWETPRTLAAKLYHSSVSVSVRGTVSVDGWARSATSMVAGLDAGDAGDRGADAGLVEGPVRFGLGRRVHADVAAAGA